MCRYVGYGTGWDKMMEVDIEYVERYDLLIKHLDEDISLQQLAQETTVSRHCLEQRSGDCELRMGKRALLLTRNIKAQNLRY
jgi:hypothetical protein